MSLDLTQILSALRAGHEIDPLVHLERIPARVARHTGLRATVDPRLERYVPELDGGLWTHQGEAIDLALGGRSVVIATGTASGKSRCFQIPLADAALRSGGKATSLLLFPTKALAQDQLRALGALGVPGLVPVTYDGDTPDDARQWARKNATTVLTNPEMLHLGLLPFHGRWSTFLHRLRFVVIDELHAYRGVFGSHLAQILRRLRRVCAHYGTSPTFIFASATIGEPAALAAEICGLDVSVVDDDGSPSGSRLLAVWRPPIADDGAPVSPNATTANLLAGLVTAGRRTIAFTGGRRSAELVAARAARIVDDELSPRIRSYRGGLLAAERRELEAALTSGHLLGVAATSALELGVDIGGLDACICNGFPGTIASFRQQIGRAGRRSEESLALLVVGNDALDQWYADHPRELVSRPAEPSVVNPANPFVLVPHLACAAHELPLQLSEAETWAGTSASVDRLGTVPLDEAFEDGVRRLVLADQLRVVNGHAVWAGRGSPAIGISLRSSSGGEVRIIDARNNDRIVGTVDAARAPASVHTGALYLHQGQQYRITSLDLDQLVAEAEATSVDEYTRVRSTTDVTFVGVLAKKRVGELTLNVGPVDVTETITGFQRIRISTGATLALEPLDLEPSSLVTRGVWYEVPDSVLERAGLVDGGAAALPGALHAAEHCGIGVLPLFAICDRWDVGGVSIAAHPQTGKPTVVIYDGYPGGSGVADLGFAAAAAHLGATRDVLATCPCTSGCPSCVQSPKCGNGNEPLDKARALAFLQAALR